MALLIGLLLVSALGIGHHYGLLIVRAIKPDLVGRLDGRPQAAIMLAFLGLLALRTLEVLAFAAAYRILLKPGLSRRPRRRLRRKLERVDLLLWDQLRHAGLHADRSAGTDTHDRHDAVTRRLHGADLVVDPCQSARPMPCPRWSGWTIQSSKEAGLGPEAHDRQAGGDLAADFGDEEAIRIRGEERVRVGEAGVPALGLGPGQDQLEVRAGHGADQGCAHGAVFERGAP